MKFQIMALVAARVVSDHGINVQTHAQAWSNQDQYERNLDLMNGVRQRHGLDDFSQSRKHYDSQFDDYCYSLGVIPKDWGDPKFSNFSEDMSCMPSDLQSPPPACNKTQHAKTFEAASEVKTQLHGSQTQGVEKPYDHSRKGKRKLQSCGYTCCYPTWHNCLGSTSSCNLLYTTTKVMQSGFSQFWCINGQTATSKSEGGCDLDVYGVPNSDKSVLTSDQCNGVNRGFWTVDLGSSKTVNTILFIQNQSTYTDINGLWTGLLNTQGYQTWLTTYRITIGPSDVYFNNPTCVTAGTITGGGWFPCGMAGRYLSVVSDTRRVAFAEIMAYTQYAIQMKAISPPSCPLCTTAAPATNALKKDVSLAGPSLSPSIVETALTDPNPTITFTLKAKTQIKAVVLLGSQGRLTYLTNTAISVKNFTATAQMCTQINDYGSYAESACNNIWGNSIIVQRLAAGMSISGFGILADCVCALSSFDPTQFTQFPVQPTSLTTIAGGGPVSTTFDLIDTVSSVCGNADGITHCGGRTVKLTDLSNGQVIAGTPYRKITWAQNSSQGNLTLQGTVNDDVGTWQLQIEVSLTSNAAVANTTTINITVTGDFCKNPIGMQNLLDTTVLPSQSAYTTVQPTYNQRERIGCNHELTNTTNDQLVFTQEDATLGLHYWGVFFPTTVEINTLLLIGPENSDISNLAKTKVSVGSNREFKNNPICIAEGAITDGGWYPCSGAGIYLALFSSTNPIVFYEVMAYACFPIQWNSVSQTWSTVAGDPAYPASNVLSKMVVITDLDTSRQKCIASQPGSAASGALIFGFKAQTTIKTVVAVPGRNPTWVNNQKNLTVKVTDVSGAVQTCGMIADYNTYQEQGCNKHGNLVTLQRSATNVQISLCSVGIFSDCTCSKSSFDSSLIFPYPNLEKILSTSSVNVTVGSNSTTILVNQIPDTVSSVCGNGDGKSYCERVVSFIDEATGHAIISWPYRDFTYVSGTLILNPVTAQTTKIRVTVRLASNSAESKSEVLKVTVNKEIGEAQYFPNQKLTAKVNETAQLKLHEAKLPSNFKIVSKQDFQTEVYGDLLSVHSTNDADQGKTFFVAMTSVPNDASMPVSSFTVVVTFAAEKEKEKHKEDATASDATASPNSTAAASPQDPSFVFAYKNQSKPADQKDEVKELPPATAKFSKMNPKGQMVIIFSRAVVMPTNDNKEMTSLLFNPNQGLVQESTAPRNLRGSAKDLGKKDLSVDKRDRRLPNLELSIEFDKDQLNHTAYDFFVSNITASNITVQAQFEDPVLISSGQVPDKLKIKVNSFAMFKTSDVKDVLISETQQAQLLPSMQLNGTAFVGAVAQTASESTQVVFIALMIGKIFFDFGMGGLDMQMKATGFLLHLMCAGISHPQVMSAFFGPLLSFLLIDIIPLSEWLEQGFNWTITPYTPNFDALGYSSGYILYNLGSLSLVLVLTPVFALILKPLQKSQCLHPKIRAWATKKYDALVWNGLIDMIEGNYLILLLCVLLNIKTYDGDWGRDMVLNNIFCILSFVVVAIFPFAYFGLTWKHYDQVMDQESDLAKKFGEHMEGYHKKRNPKTVVMASRFMYYVKVIILCCAYVWLTEYAWAVIVINNFVTLYEMMFVVYFKPHEDPRVNVFNAKAAIVYMVFNYHMLCLTQFVPDPQTRYYIGCSACALVALDLLIAIITWAKDTYHLIARFFKRKCIYEPRQKKAQKKSLNELKRLIRKRAEAGIQYEDDIPIQGFAKRKNNVKQVVPVVGAREIVEEKTFVDEENDGDWGIKISPRLLVAGGDYPRRDSDCYEQFNENIRSQWGQQQESEQNYSELEYPISDEVRAVGTSWHQRIPQSKLIPIQSHEMSYLEEESKQELPSYTTFMTFQNNDSQQEINRIYGEVQNELQLK